jgi:sterol desaturase/sphingolipid hydroxylase (fatty acid hydroxylase superfamily)
VVQRREAETPSPEKGMKQQTRELLLGALVSVILVLFAFAAFVFGE